jgi:hypothetical protein
VKLTLVNLNLYAFGVGVDTTAPTSPRDSIKSNELSLIFNVNGTASPAPAVPANRIGANTQCN